MSHSIGPGGLARAPLRSTTVQLDLVDLQSLSKRATQIVAQQLGVAQPSTFAVQWLDQLVNLLELVKKLGAVFLRSHGIAQIHGQMFKHSCLGHEANRVGWNTCQKIFN